MLEQDDFYAHTPNKKGDWQLLHTHLLEVGKLTKELASKFSAGELGYVAGLLHDIGKFNPEFREYLIRCAKDPNYTPAKRIPHAVYGCYVCTDALEFLQPIIAGHHAGIYAVHEMEELLNKHRDKVSIILEKATRFLEQHLKPVSFPNEYTTALQIEVLLRFLFSCLVDADSRNTAVHAGNEPAELPERPSIDECASYFHQQYEERMQGKTGVLNDIRRDIYKQCRRKGQERQGIYRLTAPTGSGKTLAAMAFALEHAKCKKLNRVIVAVPYTSIIDQNAEEYRKYLPEGALLEHHSAIEFDPEEKDASERAARWREAAARWDYPVIVTTTVQLLESLFSNKRSRCRKLHNITKSVIVIDEAQTLPPALLDTTVDMLKTLTERFGVTLLLSTATQPALGPNSSLGVKFPEMVEVVENPARYFQALERVKYEFDEEQTTWDALAEDIRHKKQVLIILNTKKNAITLWQKLGDKEAFHLSTLLCPAHRDDMLEKINERLANHKPCRLISTQVVEAGVNLDFPTVFRVFGPLDRIVQAAGRCNREGSPKKGVVRIFLPVEGSAPPGEYRRAMEAAELVLRSSQDLHDPGLYDYFFNLFYRSVKTDKHEIQRRREFMDYREVAKRYRFFEETDTVLIQTYPSPQSSPVPALLDTIRQRGYPLREDWQKLQQYMVSLRHSDFAKFVSSGDIEEDYLPGIHLWKANYHSKLGIAGFDVFDPTDLITD